MTRRFAPVLLLAFLATPALAGSFEQSFPFELDRWYEIDYSEGPITLHRLRIEEQSGGLTKSKLFRPGNDEYLQTIQIQIEYTNESSRDYDLDVDIHWLDRSGEIIDGYVDEEDMDDESRHDLVTVTLSTLQYGLDHATRLAVDLSF